MPLSRRLALPLLTVAAVGMLAASPAAAAPSPRTPGIAELSAQRVELADKVAAAKWGTDKPIDDPAREQALLEDVAQRSAGMGLDPDEATAVFRDQIEANKKVQRGLFARWDAHPDERPDRRPDLAKEVRPALDRLTDRLLAALRGTEEARHSPTCTARVAHGTLRTAHAHHFDALHAAGLERAVRSVCADRH
ncbi:chorismate mutase [Streptomyces sp. ODS28]|uniref:chorismate mutase n=1 Tax=Streptomyces sp. ODS28 TaxID=3136688 RepID=UPI0031EBCE93